MAIKFPDRLKFRTIGEAIDPERPTLFGVADIVGFVTRAQVVADGLLAEGDLVDYTMQQTTPVGAPSGAWEVGTATVFAVTNDFVALSRGALIYSSTGTSAFPAYEAGTIEIMITLASRSINQAMGNAQPLSGTANNTPQHLSYSGNATTGLVRQQFVDPVGRKAQLVMDTAVTTGVPTVLFRQSVDGTTWQDIDLAPRLLRGFPLNPAANTMPLFDGAYGATAITTGATGRALLGAANAAAGLTTLGAAPLASPTFTGTPAAPTAAAGTNTTQLATTAFVTTAVATAGAGYVTLSTAQTIDGQKVFTANPRVLKNTPLLALEDTNVTDGTVGRSMLIANAAGVLTVYRDPTASTITGRTTLTFPTTSGTVALLQSPTFTGTPAAPTAAAGTNTTQVATTAFVTTAVAAAAIPLPLSVGNGGSGKTTGAVANAPNPGSTSSTLTDFLAAVSSYGNNSIGSINLSDDGGSWHTFASVRHRSGVTDGGSYGYLLEDRDMTGAHYNAFVLRKHAAGTWLAPVTLWHNGNLVKQASTIDTTAGAVLINEAFGLGAQSTGYTLGNLNDATRNGFFKYATSVTGAPDALAGSGIMFGFDTNTQCQIASPAGANGLRFRRKGGGGWQGWTTLLDAELAQTISATKTFTANPIFRATNPTIALESTSVAEATVGRWAQLTNNGGVTRLFIRAGSGGAPISAGEQVVTFPSVAGTLALTSDIAAKANIASPTFTGTPAAPTATAGTNTTQLATTAFVTTAVANAAAGYVTLAGAQTITAIKTHTAAVVTANAVAFRGTATTGTVYNLAHINAANIVHLGDGAAPTQIHGNAMPTVQIGSGTAYAIVDTNTAQTLVSKTLTSPVLNGTPTAPTAAQTVNNTQVATTAYVRSAVSLATSKLSDVTYTSTYAVGVGTGHAFLRVRETLLMYMCEFYGQAVGGPVGDSQGAEWTVSAALATAFNSMDIQTFLPLMPVGSVSNSFMGADPTMFNTGVFSSGGGNVINFTFNIMDKDGNTGTLPANTVYYWQFTIPK